MDWGGQEGPGAPEPRPGHRCARSPVRMKIPVARPSPHLSPTLESRSCIQPRPSKAASPFCLGAAAQFLPVPSEHTPRGPSGPISAPREAVSVHSIRSLQDKNVRKGREGREMR